VNARLDSWTDQELADAARAGNRAAFGTLWERHAPAGRRFAAATTRAFDPDDLVAEAYTKIYAAILAGKGPTGPFRPYLLVTIRNLAVSWARQRRDGPLEDADDVPDPRATDARVLAAADADLTIRAFRTLPDRWQQVLWLTEVDGLSSAEAAARMGMTISGVGMLALRAREGLRQAWIQAHIDTSALGPEHQWALQQIGQNARGKLRPRAKAKFDAHLTSCAGCSLIATEAVDTSNRFTAALVPLAVGILGVSSLGAFLHSGQPTTGTAPTAEHSRNADAVTPAVSGRRGRAFLVVGAVAFVALTGAAIGNAVTQHAAVSPAVHSPTHPDDSPSSAASPSAAPRATAPRGDSTPSNIPRAQPASPAPPTMPAPRTSQPAQPASSGPTRDLGPVSQTPSLPAEPPVITTVDTAGGVLYPAVAGTARPGSTVTVSGGSSSPVTVTADPRGRWQIAALRANPGAVTINATADGITSATRTAQVHAPQLFAVITASTVEVTIRGATSTSYAVQWDGDTAEETRTNATGTATVTLDYAAPSTPHTVAVHAKIGTRVGPETAARIAAQP